MTIALFMAAGVGSRIATEIAGLPKCLLPIAGKPNLTRNIEFLRNEHQIESVVTVGYQHELVKNTAVSSGATTVTNYDFRENNSIVSLFLALEKVAHDQDILIFNADVCFDFSLFRHLEKYSEYVGMLADSTRKIEADYKLIWNLDLEISEYGKNIDASLASGEYVGFAKIPATFVPQLVEKINEYLKAGYTSKWWEEVIFENSYLFKAKAIDVAGEFWSEFDYLADYKRAEEYFRFKN